MKKIIVIFTIFVVIIQITGCSCIKGKGGGITTILAPTVRWNDTNYTITSEIVSSDDIGEQLNTIKKNVKNFPKENAESNNLEVGTTIYRIKNEYVTDAIAIQNNKKYLKAVIESKLKK